MSSEYPGDQRLARGCAARACVRAHGAEPREGRCAHDRGPPSSPSRRCFSPGWGSRDRRRAVGERSHPRRRITRHPRSQREVSESRPNSMSRPAARPRRPIGGAFRSTGVPTRTRGRRPPHCMSRPRRPTTGASRRHRLQPSGLGHLTAASLTIEPSPKTTKVKAPIDGLVAKGSQQPTHLGVSRHDTGALRGTPAAFSGFVGERDLGADRTRRGQRGCSNRSEPVRWPRFQLHALDPAHPAFVKKLRIWGGSPHHSGPRRLDGHSDRGGGRCLRRLGRAPWDVEDGLVTSSGRRFQANWPKQYDSTRW